MVRQIILIYLLELNTTNLHSVSSLVSGVKLYTDMQAAGLFPLALGKQDVDSRSRLELVILMAARVAEIFR